jgi:dihydroflavonol-4-reductase
VPVTEETPFDLQRVRLPYVHAKREAEQIALEAASRGRDVVVVNPAYLVGPDDHEHSVMGRFCVRFWKGRLPLVPPGGVNLVDVRDVAAGHLLAAEYGLSGRRYLLGGEDHSFAGFERLLAEVSGLRPRALPRIGVAGLAFFALFAEGRARLAGKEAYPSFGHVRLNSRFWFCKSDRARLELGHAARPLRQTLADAYRWHLEKGNVPLRGFGRWWMRPSTAPAA